ncbi:MAG: riboflavin synthase [Candidatus Dormibacteria bacterium]
MFAGIVSIVGRVESLPSAPPGQLVIGHSQEWIAGGIGDSVSVSGCCLTLVDFGPAWIAVEVMPETLRRTTLGGLEIGDRVNLEPALQLRSAVGGHLVSGHIDARGRIRAVNPEENAVWLEIEVPAPVGRYCVPQGSIAVDGCSLTLVTVADGPKEAAVIRVSLIPHTVASTIASGYHPGDLVNLEADQIAKLVERLVAPHRAGLEPAGPWPEAR